MSVSNPPTTFKVGLTADEKLLYSQIFKTLDPDGTGIITGDKARSTFEKSGLPPTILGEIWQLADRSNLGFLTQFGFCYAMRLIGHTQAGQAPSPTLAETPGPLPKFANLNVNPQLQPQSTNGSFMQSQPSSVVPQNTSFQSQPQDPIPPVSAVDYKKFADLFVKTVGTQSANLPGGAARDIFLKAKLPTPTLGQIWNLVDTENLGTLSLPSFVVAMHLIQGLLSGTIKQLPPFLSDNIWRSVRPEDSGSRQTSYSSVSSQQTTKYSPAPQPQRAPSQAESPAGEWVATPVMKQQYDSIFNNLDKQKSGTLSPDQVASFLMTSKLNQNDLAAIWDLSDIQNTGVFTKVEFSIALFLVNKRLAGVPLPNIVPDALLDSLNQQQSHAASPVKEERKPLSQQKTAIDDLADVFGVATPPVSTPTEVAPPQKPVLETRTSSSDLTPNELPKVRKNLTSSFKPTSTFGQSLMHKDVSTDDNLLGEDVKKDAPSPQPVAQQQSPVKSAAPVQPEPPAARTVNYDALRSVPPPPRKSTGITSPPVLPSPTGERTLSNQSFGSPAPPHSQPTNPDLLADPEISGQLSQATSDIANISNQVKSLTSQTSQLHEKKGRAEEELAKILATKKEIESKLKQLKASYDNEVQQYQEVETKLNQAKEEAEALRSESSIAEAKFNHVSGELNQRQVDMETLQKENSAMKEKLGYVNAEIAEVEKQFQTLQEENNRLTNQLSVKKSQAQVVIVKKEELQSQLADLHASNKKLQDDINKAAKDQEAAEQEHANLQSQVTEAKNFKPTEPPRSKSSSSHAGLMGVAGAAVGAIAGGAVAAASGLASAGEKAAETVAPSSGVESPAPVKKDVPVISQPTEKDVTSAVPSSDEPSPVDVNQVPPVAALVDEVKTKPSGDMTGIEDVEQEDDSSVKDSETLQDKLQEKEIPGKFDNEDATNATTASSMTTDKIGDGETPVTSPSNSDFQFPQGSGSTIPGGMVGLPGVLVGVQRTDSLTSSVQNNAALSVRDDNIEVSDRETLENDESINEPSADPSAEEPRENLESDKLSSGVGSFEIVNADEAKEGQFNYQEENAPSGGNGTNSFVIRNPLSTSPNVDEEFPPIKELDYDESDSSDDAQDFDDAKDHLPSETSDIKQDTTKDEFDGAFDDLEPAQEEQAQQENDDFDDFDGLETAKVEDTSIDEFGQENYFSNDFTSSNMPDFSQGATETGKTGGNDEWEQLFAGFGNAQPAEPEQPAAPASATAFPPSFEESQDSEKDSLVQELVGMGFDEKTAIDALRREDWDLQSATNFLLDHA